ncbi:MAG: hypothetical protein V7609_2131 [Verrucomicrobiota bacterium]
MKAGARTTVTKDEKAPIRRPSLLRAGRRCVWKGREIIFQRRITSAQGSPRSVFVCPAFAGLDGPNDKGLVEFTDRAVTLDVYAAETAATAGDEAPWNADSFECSACGVKHELARDRAMLASGNFRWRIAHSASPEVTPEHVVLMRAFRYRHDHAKAVVRQIAMRDRRSEDGGSRIENGGLSRGRGD